MTIHYETLIIGAGNATSPLTPLLKERGRYWLKIKSPCLCRGWW